MGSAGEADAGAPGASTSSSSYSPMGWTEVIGFCLSRLAPVESNVAGATLAFRRCRENVWPIFSTEPQPALFGRCETSSS